MGYFQEIKHGGGKAGTIYNHIFSYTYISYRHILYFTLKLFYFFFVVVVITIISKAQTGLLTEIAVLPHPTL